MSFDWSEPRRENLRRALTRQIAGEVRFEAASRSIYATDASHYQITPIGVVIPRTKADVHAAVAIAREQSVPIIARGGGTSLSGQSIGPGLVIDFRKHLRQILEINPLEEWVRVEPGVVLAELNTALAASGHQFGPEVATIDRANLGGMIANNSAGSRSIRYGKTIDHVISLECHLADSRTVELGPVAPDQYAEWSRSDDRLGSACRTVSTILQRDAAEIRRRYPNILRRVSGYNLDALLTTDPPNLAKLIVGSEGTLALMTEAKLRIVPLPKARGIAVVEYARLEDALLSLAAILSTRPSAVELLDQMILDLARASPQHRAKVEFLRGQPAAIFIVEFSEDSPAAVDERFIELRGALVGLPTVHIQCTRQEALADAIWSVRKLAMPLLLAIPGAKKPVTFVEDTAVDPSRLPEFVARFTEILRRHDAVGSFYGHASVGCLHIRPMIDLGSTTGRERFVAIADAVADLVLEFGGAMSGEHGDGLCRSYFNPRMFGDRIYADFVAIKQAFDPLGLFNPGKIVAGPPIDQNLRPAPALTPLPDAGWLYATDDSPLAIVERCNGNGLCRRTSTGIICPSYRATMEEQESPRGRANLLRHALQDETQTWWRAPGLAETLDQCLGCKACKTECPSGVDIAKIKAEVLHQRYQLSRPPLLARMLGDLRRHNELGSRLAPFSNWVMRSAPFRWLLHGLVGIDARRRLPKFVKPTLVQWLAKRRGVGSRPTKGRVVLLADCFTNFHEPAIGQKAIELLERAGFAVQLANLCCGRTAISQGLLDHARRTVQVGVEQLARYVDAEIPILGLEPSCLFTLADEWGDLVDHPAIPALSASVRLVETLLADHADAGWLPRTPPATLDRVLVHGHCHQKSAGALVGAVAALEKLAWVKPTVLDTTCCGMAGAFGYETKHYPLSVAVAEQSLLPKLRTEPDLPVVAPGFSCRSQIADLLRRRALHPIELIHQRLQPVP